GVDDAQHLDTAPDEPRSPPASRQKVQGLGQRYGVPGHANRCGICAELPLTRNEHVQQVGRLHEKPGEKIRRRRKSPAPRTAVEFFDGCGKRAEQACCNGRFQTVARKDVMRLMSDNSLKLRPRKAGEESL